MNVIKKVIFIALMIWLLFYVSSYATTATVNTEAVRIRREASTTSDVISIVYKNEEVTVMEQQGEWYKVEYKEYTGFIRSDLLNLLEEKPIPAEENPNEVMQEIQEPLVLPNPNNQTQTLQETTIQKVVNANTSLRMIPSISASKIDEITLGTVVEVIQIKNNWTCIEFNGKSAWIPNIALVDKAEEQAILQEQENILEVIKTMYVNVNYANIRTEPTTSSEILTTMAKNKALEILEDVGEWYKIKLDNHMGYISKPLVSEQIDATTSRNIEETRQETPVQEVIQQQVKEIAVPTEPTITTNNSTSVGNSSTQTGDSVVAYAKQFLGCRYVYGGAGPNSFDCSGFTQYVYKNFGIYLSHSAVTQANNGTYVEKANLQLGDLIIFKDWDNASIGHCGIYIGNSKFIHAANPSRGVVTDTFASGYYYERYVCARRLF